jgi:hypothetical protein
VKLMVIGSACCVTAWSTAHAQSQAGSPTAGASSTGVSSTPPAAPRLPDGTPDLNGTWDNGGGIGFLNPQKLPDGSICILCPPAPVAGRPAGAAPAGPPPGMMVPDRPKYKPEYQAKVKDLDSRQVETDPALRCRNPGLPRIGPPDKIVQIPGQVVFLYDDLSGSFFRIIPTNGAKHRSDVEASYLGDAVGRWEGDTLVVESTNFLDESWLTDDGAFHTSGLKVTERLRRVGNQIEYQAVAEDPAVLAEPWNLRPRALQLTAVELVEPPPCIEQSLDHIVDGTHHDNPR